jgi:DNA-binding NarL/FixJ family response regulator
MSNTPRISNDDDEIVTRLVDHVKPLNRCKICSAFERAFRRELSQFQMNALTEALTTQQCQIFAWYLGGASVEEIAVLLEVAAHTVALNVEAATAVLAGSRVERAW